jgi:hypothetical protein
VIVVDAEQDERLYPCMQVVNLEKVVARFRETMPKRVDVDWMLKVQANKSRGTASSNVSQLRRIGLVDTEGKPTARANLARLGGQRLEKACQEILSDCYPDELVEEWRRKQPDLAALRDYFMEVTCRGQKLASDQARLFAWFLAGGRSEAQVPRRAKHRTPRVAAGSKPLRFV